MPKVGKNYKISLSTNGIQSATAGRKNQSKMTTVNGRYMDSRQAFSSESGGKIGRQGQLVSRRKQYYDVRVGLGLAGG